MRAALAMVACLLAASAAAQQVALAPSAALQCLTHQAAKSDRPEYPFVAFKSNKPGRVKVALRFTGPALRPAVKVLETDGEQDMVASFVESVEDFVRGYRVPCHDGSAVPVELVFDFVFRRDDRQVHWLEPVDGSAPQRQRMLDCVLHTSGEKPEYPNSALWNRVQGRVLALLHFEAPDAPPRAELLSQSSARPLAHYVESWVQGYRMPCHQGGPISSVWTFVFVIEGDAFGFKPGLTFRNLLPMVKDIRKQRLNFDFNRMACPFDVKLQYRRPALHNLVAEVGSPDPARRPFLDWLAQLELDLSRRTLDATYGDTVEFQVPCLILNLNPQE